MESFYSPLFELIEQWYPLDVTTREQIIAKSSVRRVRKSDFLFREGQDGSKLYLVIQGALRVFVLDNNFKEHVIRFGFENRMIGDIRAFLYQTQSELNVQAIENSVLLEVSAESLRELFTLSESLSLFYKDFLEFELSLAQDRIINHLAKDAEGRYLDFISEYGAHNNRISDRHIASYIGVTPEFFSKLKKKKIREFLELR